MPYNIKDSKICSKNVGGYNLEIPFILCHWDVRFIPENKLYQTQNISLTYSDEDATAL